MKRMFKKSYTLLLLTLTVLYNSKSSYAQQHGTSVTRLKAPADVQYNKAGKLKRVLLGEHYRKDWATEVELEILDFDVVAGGLTPVKLGGGMQTLSLRLKGADGKEYVLRSVKKDPSKALPEMLAGTIADDILQDQISSSNPFAAVAVASLAESADILHSTPRIFYVQDANQLGEYKDIFANSICLLEERPMGNQASNAAMNYSRNVINSQKLFDKISSDNIYRVDERAYVKARLFDMWIGDWDRHQDQWTWAEFRSGDHYIYQPVPRDRDQAFAKLDGIIPQIAEQPWAVRKTKDFDYKIHDIAGLNMSANYLDRSFTTQLSKQDWIDISVELRSVFTDEVIETAIMKMPPEIFALSGKEIIAKLKNRRDLLTKYAIEYYTFLSREVNITGTKKQESFQIKRVNSDSTDLFVYSAEEKKLLYQRTFLTSETREIRLYGLEGNDLFELTGKAENGILVRVIGGQGHDSIFDRSVVGKTMLHKTKIYDDGKNFFATGSESTIYISSDSIKNDYNRKSFVYDWFGPKQSPGYNPDDGIYIGGGLTFRKQQFGKQPYGYTHSIWGNYAFQTGAFNLWYAAEFKEFIGKWDLQLNAKINAPNYSRNYFGIGNDTKINTKDNKYYRVRLDQEFTSVALVRQFGAHHHFLAGNSLESIKIEETNNRFIKDAAAELDSNVFERKYYTGAFMNYQYNTLDNQLFPRKGIRLKAAMNYSWNVRDDINLIRLSYESAFFFSRGKWTAALRSGMATNLDDEFEFFQANTLGGTENLRGFRRDRFSGKTSVFQNTELRYKINRYNGYIFRGEYGVLSFVDHGRVWSPGEQSDSWHTGYGAGFWIFIYNKIPITATYGISKEDKIVNIKAGFLF